jgi:hypothetical protein
MRKGWPKGKRRRGEIVVDRNGPVIDSSSIQAKIWPEIANTNCWISNKTHRWIVRETWTNTFGSIPVNLNYKNNRSYSICHKCDCIYGLCVNPLHLFLGTDKDNARDKRNKGRVNVTSESAKKSVQTKKKNGNFYSSLSKTWETRRKNGTDKKTGNSEGALKGVETKRKNGTLKGFTSESIQKSLETKLKNGTNHTTALKAWETKRKKKMIGISNN